MMLGHHWIRVFPKIGVKTPKMAGGNKWKNPVFSETSIYGKNTCYVGQLVGWRVFFPNGMGR